MSNTNIELNEARAKLAALQDNSRIYKGLNSLFDGQVIPGDKLKIEFVAFAIRGNYSIPLKYTQSYASLRVLYQYAQEKNDTMLIQWTERQINQVLGPMVLITIRNELQGSKIIPVTTRSNRQEFLEKYRNMSLNDLYSFSLKEESATFWGKQLQRLHHVNLLREQVTGPSPDSQIRPFSDLLKVSLYNEASIKSGSEYHPDKIIKDSKVSPFVIIPSLIELHAQHRNIQAIFLSPYLKNGLIFKKFAIPNDILEKLLKKNKFDESDYQPFMAK